jgi:hypothetical protein
MKAGVARGRRSCRELRAKRPSWAWPAAVMFAFGGATVSNARELTPALLQTIHRGKPPGSAVLRGVDWGRARRAELPAPSDARVLWQRRIAGGLSGDVLVDAAGRVFVAGLGRVLQLGPDGRDEYARGMDFSSAVASALLADGQRVVLAREGTLAAWSPRGDPPFQLAPQVPAGWARGDLLPLPDGGVLVSAGAWLFEVNSHGEIEGYAQLKEPAAETLVSAGQAWILLEHGDVLTWDGRSAPVKQGSFRGRVSAAAVRAPGQLLAIVDGRELAGWSQGSAGPSSIASLDGAGNGARLSVPTSGRVFVLGSTGALFSVLLEAAPSTAAPERQPLPGGSGDVLSGADGTLAWLVANAPLTLQQADGITHALDEVVCTQPASLAPAGTGRLLAACRSGQLWLVGPAAPTVDTPPEVRAPAPPSVSAAPHL